MLIKVILTGATGMVGEGVLLECLKDERVEKILAVGRRSCGYTDPKLEELILPSLDELSPAANNLAGYDACFFCAGVSSIGKKEDEFTKLTYDMTVHFAEIFKKENPAGELTFCYVSGYGTDSLGHGKSMWARVKGCTENKLIEMFGSGAYMFRPGYMKPTKGQKRILKFYFGWRMFYPIMKLLMSRFTCELAELGRAMINCVVNKPEKSVLEVRDIVSIAK